jgi:hypothetical protein
LAIFQVGRKERKEEVKKGVDGQDIQKKGGV